MLLNFEKDKKEEYAVPMNEGMRRIPAYSILNLLNKIFVRLQRWMQGIPGGPAYLYNCIATKYLEPSYNHVVKEIEERFFGKRCNYRGGMWHGKTFVRNHK